MRFLKCIINIALFILIIGAGAVRGFAQAPDTQNWISVLNYDFDDGSTPSRIVSRPTGAAQGENVHSMVYVDAYHKNAAKFSLSNNGALLDLNLMADTEKDLDDLEIKGNSGRYEISYDVMYTNRSQYAPYIRLCGDYRSKTNDTWWLNNNNYSMVLSVIGAQSSSHSFSYGKSHTDGWYGNYVQNGTVSKSTNEWVSTKVIVDTVNNTADYYYKANSIGNDYKYVGSQSGMFTADGNSYKSGIRHLEFQAISDSLSSNVYFDNISIKREPATINSIDFLDIDENPISIDENISKELRKIEISLSGTVYDELCYKNISLKNGTTEVSMHAVYDEQNKKYTIYIPKRLNNGSYTLTVFDKTYSLRCAADYIRFDENLYDEKGAEVKRLVNLKSGDKVKVKADFNSSGTSKNRLIIAAYDGTTLKNIKMKTFTYVSYNKNEISIDIPAANDLKIKAFVWNADDSIKPYGDIFETKADFVTDFEDGVTCFETSGTCSIDMYDNEHGKSLCLQSGSAKKYFMVPIKSGVAKFGFKYLPNKSFSKLIMYMCDNKSEYAILNDTNRFGYYQNGSITDSANVFKQRGNDAWYQIDVYADMDSKIVFFYIDNEYFGATELNIDSLDGVKFVSEGDGVVYFDDVSLGINCDNLPEEVKGDIDIQISDNCLARTYFDKENAVFKAKLTNKTDIKKTITLKSFVLDEDKTIYEVSQDVSIDPNSKKDVEITVKPKKFGYLSLLIKAEQNENTIGVSPVYDFAVANIPQEGKRDKNFGIQLHGTWPNQRFGDVAKNFEMIEKLGIGFVRSECLWEEFEYIPGTYIFSAPYRTLYDVTKEKGVKIGVVLGFGNNKIISRKVPESDTEIKAFAKYAAEVIKAHEYQIDDIEVWNEWTNYGTFNPDKVGFDVYGKILKAVKEAVDAEPKGKNTSVWADEPSAAEDANVVKYNDGYAWHPYNNKGTPESWINGLTEPMNQLNERNGKTARIYASEFGWPSVGKSGYATEKQQAAFFIRASVLNKAYNWFEKMSWYTANDGGYTDDIEDHFGMLKPSDNNIPYFPKPVYLAAGNYMNLMMNSEYTGMSRLGEYTYVFYFTLEDGRDAAVVWTAETLNNLKDVHTENVSVPFEPNSIQVIDMYGNVQKTMWSGGAYNIEATGEPLYLIQK